MLDKKTFYDYIRPSNLFHNNLSQQQVNGIEAILDCWNSGPQGLFKGPVYDAHLSYMLATVYHETDKTMSAVKEAFYVPGVSENWRKEHLKTKQGKSYYPWYGRGLVQLTWEYNYKKLNNELKPFFPQIDLISNPDQALDPKIAVGILFCGMSRGSFTGVSLHTYIHGGMCDFVQARKIINGTNCDKLIAGYAKTFNDAVKAATAAYKGTSNNVMKAPEPTSVR